jgi:hypothetical protein
VAARIVLGSVTFAAGTVVGALATGLSILGSVLGALLSPIGLVAAAIGAAPSFGEKCQVGDANCGTVPHLASSLSP